MTAAPSRACCETSSSARGSTPASCRPASSPRVGELPRPPVDLHTVIEGTGGGTDGPTGVLGSEYLSERIGELTFRVSHGAFLQTNTLMAERLYTIVAEFAGLTGSERLFDLYCGIGTIGLSLAARAGEVWGLESVGRGDRRRRGERGRERDRERPLRRTPTRGSGSARCSSRPASPTWSSSTRRAPGSRRKIVRRLLECEARRVVYVSCNPTTLAPNAAQMIEAGYTLRRVKPVDMFPQTPHVECVAVLERDA